MKSTKIALLVNTELDLIASKGTSERVLELVVRAPESSKHTSRPPLNLALILDHSGSMSGAKLEYAKQAALHVIDLLGPSDQAALVAFDTTVSLLSPSLAITPANRQTLKHLVRMLESGATTNLSGGWLTGCSQVAEAARNGSLNRALLLTDGLANVGITDPEILAQHALELSRRGVSTSTFGVGLDYNHHLLEAMANQGGGSYYYIEEPRDILNIFAREFREIAAATAADVAVYLTLPEGTRSIVLGGWRTETSEDQLRIELGALYSNREQPIYIKLLLDPGSNNADLPVKAIVRGKLINGMLLEAEAVVVFKLADQAAVDAARRDPSVLERCAQVEMADQTIEALKLEREGRREQAAQLMKDSINTSSQHLKLQELQSYNQILGDMQTGLPETVRKQRHYEEYKKRRSREE